VIYKELDPFNSDDKFAKTGRAAEEQMAFYFKRFFSNDPDILILNGIRLEADGDAAQVDHLVIHSHGLSIVESKSVHGKIQIKDDGQWIRWFGANQSKGMASPITQARLQEKFFRGILGKASKNEAFFEKLPIDLYVAISDGGVIIWPPSGQVPGVCKSDQVPDKIIDSNRLKAKTTGALELSKENRERIAAFLVAANKPLVKSADIAPTTPPAIPAIKTPKMGYDSLVTSQSHSTHSCKYCGSTSLEIRYAYTYFFYCLKCEKNTPIKTECPSCHEPAKLRKHKKEFFIECEKHQHSAPFFVNP
jgi:hypothetical protein